MRCENTVRMTTASTSTMSAMTAIVTSSWCAGAATSLVGAAEMTHHCVPSTSNGVATEKNDVPSGIFHVPEACAFALIASAKSLLRAGSIGSSLNCGIVGCEMFMTPTRSGTLL